MPLAKRAEELNLVMGPKVIEILLNLDTSSGNIFLVVPDAYSALDCEIPFRLGTVGLCVNALKVARGALASR